MQNPKRLRELARWYRDFAEKTGNPAIWDLRLRRADDLDAEAARLESMQVAHPVAIDGEAEDALMGLGER